MPVTMDSGALGSQKRAQVPVWEVEGVKSRAAVSCSTGVLGTKWYMFLTSGPSLQAIPPVHKLGLIFHIYLSDFVTLLIYI